MANFNLPDTITVAAVMWQRSYEDKHRTHWIYFTGQTHTHTRGHTGMKNKIKCLKPHKQLVTTLTIVGQNVPPKGGARGQVIGLL